MGHGPAALWHLFGARGAWESLKTAIKPQEYYEENMAEREMKVSQEQMAEARLDLAYRDYCAHLLIPLNRCRRRTVSCSSISKTKKTNFF